MAIDRERLIRSLVLLLVLVAVTGCAAKRAFHAGEKEMRRENYDKAVLGFSKAVALDPGNSRYDVALSRAKIRAADEHFTKGKRFAASGQLELAIAEYQQTLLLNASHQHASNELQRAIRALQARDHVPSEIEKLKEQARRRDFGPPRLDPRANIAILLNFTDVKVGKIFEAIGKASGINFIFDDKTDLDKPMTIDIGNVTLEKALDILMLQTKNFYKVIDEYTLLVAPDTRQKRQEYEDQVIRTFFLSNADTKQVVTLLRSLLQARQVAENADLNSVTIKDSPDKVAIAERIIGANDKAKGEVLIDVELLEINRSTARTLGIDLSSKALSLSFRDGQSSVALNNFDSLNQAGNWTIGVIPSVLLTFLKSDADTRVIAKPQLRVSEGEQAEILIGDRVPIPTTSFNTSNTIGSSVVPITSFTYQNVGITVQMEPRVHHNKEITLRIQVEVSQLGDSISTGGGFSQPVIGTRQIQTVIRLRDGETNMLAGLIQRSKSDSYSGVAGLGDIPGLRRVLGGNTMSTRETDIIMTLTPRIIRIPDITEEDLLTLWVGTEEHMTLRGPARNALNQSPFASEDEEAVAAVTPEPPPPTGGALTRMTPGAEVQRAEAELEGAQAASEPQGSTPTEPAGEEVQTTESPVGAELLEEAAAAEPEQPGKRRQGQGSSGQPAAQEIQPAAVRLVPNKPTYNVGETVVVEVVVENARDVGSIPFHLKFNTNVLQFVPPGTEGGFMNRDGTQTVFLANDTGGQVVVGLSRLGGGEGMDGSGKLATFQFIAVGPGDAGFGFTGSSVKDPKAGNLPAVFTPMSVKVEP